MIFWQERTPKALGGFVLMRESAGDTGWTKARALEKHISETEAPLDLPAKMCCHSSRAIAEYVRENEELYTWSPSTSFGLDRDLAWQGYPSDT